MLRGRRVSLTAVKPQCLEPSLAHSRCSVNFGREQGTRRIHVRNAPVCVCRSCSTDCENQGCCCSGIICFFDHQYPAACLVNGCGWVAGYLRSGRRKGLREREKVRRQGREEGTEKRKEGGRLTESTAHFSFGERQRGSRFLISPGPELPPCPPTPSLVHSMGSFLTPLLSLSCSLGGDLREDDTHLFCPWLCPQHPPRWAGIGRSRKICQVNQIKGTSPNAPECFLPTAEARTATTHTQLCHLSRTPSRPHRHVRKNAGAGPGAWGWSTSRRPSPNRTCLHELKHT